MNEFLDYRQVPVLVPQDVRARGMAFVPPNEAPNVGQNLLAMYRHKLNQCDNQCRCIFNHETEDDFHKGAQVMSNILPGVCRDHTTSVFGLDETYDEYRKSERQTCTVTTRKVPRIVARSLKDGYYAFANHDQIVPYVEREVMFNVYTAGVDHEQFQGALFFSSHLKNFIRSIEDMKLTVYDVCQGLMADKSKRCNLRALIDACALYSYLTMGIFADGFSPLLQVDIDEIAVRFFGEVGAWVVFANQKIIMNCVKDMQNALGVNERDNVVRSNFQARCELYYTGVFKPSYRPNIRILMGVVEAEKDICNNEKLRATAPEGQNPIIQRFFQENANVPGNRREIIKPPLSSMEKSSFQIQGGETPEIERRAGTVSAMLDNCRASIGVY